MKRFFYSTLLISTLLSANAGAIETAAKHAYMIDAETGAVLLNKDGEVAMIPSSMTKLMTVYIVFNRLKEGRLKLDDMLTVSEKAWRMQGSKMFVGINTQVSVDDLLHGVIVQSGNDACIVLAEGIAGSEGAFVAEMNEMAKKIGLTQTTFKNVTGWPDEGHVMSARDLATLADHIITEFPEYYAYDSLKEFTYNNITQQNRNRLLGNDIGVDGMKTGHTDAGGYGIVLSAKHDGRRLILVVNGLESDDARMKEGDQLLRWGFREFQNKKLVSAGKEVAKADVWFGTEKQVPLVAEKDVVVTMPAGNAPAGITYALKYTGPLPAPVAKGAHVADLVVGMPNADAQVIPLVAANDVPKLSGFGKAVAVIKHYLGIEVMRGRFITIEGGEGSGKSTQIRLLGDALEKAGIAHVITREPGGEEGAEAIRNLLVTGDKGRWDALTETLLFSAARVQHVKRLVEPALAGGTWVVCDRFVDSTRVYQGIGKNISRAYIDALHALTLGNLMPDTTFVLDIDPEKGLARTKGRAGNETRFESMDLQFHKQVRAGFLAIAREEKERCHILDASQKPETLHGAVLKKLGILA